MRILHLDSETGFRGGERQVLLLAQGLKKRGHEQLLVGPQKSQLAALLAGDGIPSALYTKPKIAGARSPLLVRWLRKVAQDFRPDVVHAHTGNSHTMAFAAFHGRIPLVTTRRVDFPIKGNWFSRRKYTAGGQRFIAISNGIRDVLIAGGVPAERIDVVYSGIDVDRVRGGDGRALRQAWLEKEQGPLIGFVGALVDHKAPWILAEAAQIVRASLPEAKVVFVGDGELRGMLEEHSAFKSGCITLAGWRDDIADCYAAFDMFVMPSKLEGLCTSLIDALAAGVPAIASNTGGIPDVIVDGKTGRLVPPLDAKALAIAITVLWEDEKLRHEFVENGHRHVQEKFTADSMVEGTEQVYIRMQR